MQNIVLLIIATLFINIQTTKAQNPTAKVQWNVSATQDSTHTKYIITAKATIDKGWHIFAAEPGGDGLLIPTTLEIENNTAVQQETPTHKGEIISEEMEAVGKVNYYKNQYQWQCNVKAKPKTKLKIIIQYQSCNEMMCLPPQTIEKIITL
jgi:thiol:disulfide interchange protein